MVTHEAMPKGAYTNRKVTPMTVLRRIEPSEYFKIGSIDLASGKSFRMEFLISQDVRRSPVAAQGTVVGYIVDAYGNWIRNMPIASFTENENGDVIIQPLIASLEKSFNMMLKKHTDADNLQEVVQQSIGYFIVSLISFGYHKGAIVYPESSTNRLDFHRSEAGARVVVDERRPDGIIERCGYWYPKFTTLADGFQKSPLARKPIAKCGIISFPDQSEKRIHVRFEMRGGVGAYSGSTIGMIKHEEDGSLRDFLVCFVTMSSEGTPYINMANSAESAISRTQCPLITQDVFDAIIGFTLKALIEMGCSVIYLQKQKENGAHPKMDVYYRSTLTVSKDDPTKVNIRFIDTDGVEVRKTFDSSMVV